MRFPAEVRKALLRNVARNSQSWTERIPFLDFFGDIFDLKSLPSTDRRCKDAEEGMVQHTVSNADWSEDDVLNDPRFSPLSMTDEQFEKFVNKALSVDTRADEVLARFVEIIAPILAHAGIRVDEHKEFGVFEGYRVSAADASAAQIGLQRLAGHAVQQVMRPSQRLELIARISSELQSRYTYDAISGYLGAYQFARPKDKYDGPNSKRLYAGHLLRDAPPDVLLSIAEDLGLSTPGTKTATPPANWRDTSRFRLFVSHIALHKDKATRLKSCLQAYAIDAFVAHEDIEPMLEWQVEIERALETMDAFLAILTPGFSKSIWTQQEIGFAVGRGATIISFQMGEDPTGFISKRQALARRSRSAEEIAVEIDAILSKDIATAGKLKAAKRAAGISKIDDDIPF